MGFEVVETRLPSLQFLVKKEMLLEMLVGEGVL
jgi:hypothetical protein